MSLKAFHIVFIIISILLGFGMGTWGFVQYYSGNGASWLLFGGGFLAGGIGLIIYSRRILRKLKDISYL